MYTLILILVVLASLLMIGIVLIQESKGGGLASNAAEMNNLLGVHKTTDVVEKITWSLVAFMVVGSVLAAYLVPSAQVDSVITNEATQQSAENPNQVPGFGASQQQSAPAADKAETPAAPAQK